MKIDGNPESLGVELGLQVETRHARHADIGNDARTLVPAAGIQEFLRRGEGLCGEPCFVEGVGQRLARMCASSSMIASHLEVRGFAIELKYRSKAPASFQVRPKGPSARLALAEIARQTQNAAWRSQLGTPGLQAIAVLADAARCAAWR